MRGVVTAEGVRRFMAALGKQLKAETRIYLVGGTSAVLCGWRESTIDVDARFEPDTEAPSVIARIKEELKLNVETASPLDFMPALPGWEGRSRFIAREGKASFFHLDFYSQALAKVERGFEKDLADVDAMVRQGLVDPARALELFTAIEPELVRYPAIDPPSFRRAVETVFAC
jgi:uncharacterized nucleotidyltransferase DUF6036